MNDNQIIIIVIGILETALIANGRADVVVQQGLPAHTRRCTRGRCANTAQNNWSQVRAPRSNG